MGRPLPAEEIAHRFIAQGLYDGSAKDPVFTLLTTLHSYVRRWQPLLEPSRQTFTRRKAFSPESNRTVFFYGLTEWGRPGHSEGQANAGRLADETGSGAEDSARVSEAVASSYLPGATAQIDEEAHVEIPEGIRKALGLKTTERIVMELIPGQRAFIGYPISEGIRRAQAAAEPFRREGVSEVDELLAERRAEAAHE